jgi:6-phosphogluconolactonase
MSVEVRDCATESELMGEVASRWVELVRLNPRLSVALSGGRVARPLFESVVGLALKQNVVFEAVEVFWADERCVPPEHPDSNYGLALEFLVRPLGIPARRVHRIRGEDDWGVAAREAERELLEVVGRGEAGPPVLDLALLGMGEDGHVASLFPGVRSGGAALEGVYQAVVGPKLPVRRITLSYGVLAAAVEVWVVVAGCGKAAALSRALQGDPELPLGRLLQMRSATRVFVHPAREGR